VLNTADSNNDSRRAGTAGDPVTAYRLYRLDGSGKIDSAEWIEADADDTAIDDAHMRFPDGSFELWHGQRFVGSGRTDRSSSLSPGLA
jgi:hypothetical protein